MKPRILRASIHRTLRHKVDLPTVHSALSPLRPRIRLRVGVSGHRVPPKLPVESEAPVRAAVDHVLALIVGAANEAQRASLSSLPAAAAAGDRPAGGNVDCEFAVVSSLAEGADRIVAEAGLAAGFDLEVVLPVSRDEYARDFTTESSLAAYRQLLDRAAAVFELDGAPEDRPRAYEAAGFVMLANVDVVIAIWDGKEANGIGGTAHIVSRAIADGIPILWIEPANPKGLKLSWSPAGEVPPANASARPAEAFRDADANTVIGTIEEIICPPAQHQSRLALTRYLEEPERRWNFCPWYPLLLLIFGGRPLRRTDFHLRQSLLDTKEQWTKFLAELPPDRAQRPAIETILLPAFSAADHLAIYYAVVYRSTYVFNFLFAAVAVALALGGIFTHDPTTKSHLVLAELATIIAILVTWLRGHRLHWHRRWLEYRRLAECLRHMRILAPIGSEGPVDRPGRSLDIDEQDWVNWYAWSLRRELPLPDRAVDPAYLSALRQAVRSVEIAGQIEYHAGNAARFAKLEPRIHRGEQLFFGMTGALCIVYLVFDWFGGLPNVAAEYGDHILGAFTFLTALFPTLGAALGGIYVQGDFKTVAEQSKRTAQRLAAIDKILADEPLVFAKFADRIEKTSDVMMSDLLEWQTVFRTRPLSLPA
jgi:hypothetical protein